MAAQDHRYAIPTEIQLELDPPWRRSSRRNSRDIYICKQQAKNRSKPQKNKNQQRISHLRQREKKDKQNWRNNKQKEEKHNNDKIINKRKEKPKNTIHKKRKKIDKNCKTALNVSVLPPIRRQQQEQH